MDINVTRELELRKVKARIPVQVNEILAKHQEEWQLWAALTEHFESPEYHSAYLSQAMYRGQLGIAAARYKAYRERLVFLANERTNINTIDIMLRRIQAMSLVIAEQKIARPRSDIQFLHYRKITMFLWLLVGAVCVGYLAHII